MRRAALALALCSAALATGPSASAFGTINELGQHAEHERITRWGLAEAGLGPATLDQLAGATGTFGAVGAPDKPGRGLADVKAAHCDGGDYLPTPGYGQGEAEARAHLEACRAWMFTNLDQAVDDAAGMIQITPSSLALGCAFDGKRRGSAKCLVLEDLGLAFHVSQDFYAHTNWVDRPAPGAVGPDNPPGLGHAEPAPWIDPAHRDTAFPAGLISGCYDGFPEPLHCGAHGPNPRVAHRWLNKDEGVIDVAARTIAPGETTRGKVEGNFERAVTAAVADTRGKWAWFAAQLTARYGAARGAEMLCLLRSDDAAGC